MTGKLVVSSSELILGGQKSGKSRRAELLAGQWLGQSPTHGAVLIATAQPWDEEMRVRIQRHQSDRAARVPGLVTVEEPLQLAAALQRHSQPQTLVLVDCLTLWLTNWLMPPSHPKSDAAGGAGLGAGRDDRLYEEKMPVSTDWQAQSAHFFEAIKNAPGPVVLVGNEIGLGVIPLGPEVRAFVDALGVLNQQAAQACTRVTLMVAGLPMTVKPA
jgi:adenosylcobinamide kinase/adenosylcobinamide-phosphate guanylyltransferase